MHKIILIIIAMIVNQTASSQDLGKLGVKKGQTAGVKNGSKKFIKPELETGFYLYKAHNAHSKTHTIGASLELFTNFKPQ